MIPPLGHPLASRAAKGVSCDVKIMSCRVVVRICGSLPFVGDGAEDLRGRAEAEVCRVFGIPSLSLCPPMFFPLCRSNFIFFRFPFFPCLSVHFFPFLFNSFHFFPFLFHFFPCVHLLQLDCCPSIRDYCCLQLIATVFLSAGGARDLPQDRESEIEGEALLSGKLWIRLDMFAHYWMYTAFRYGTSLDCRFNFNLTT